MASESDNEALLRLIRGASRILVFTGAGVSTRSGIPDFRGPQGLWKHQQPVYFDAFLASEEARVEYWGQKLEGREAFLRAACNDVHRAVVELERAGRLLLLVTQNIDGLHRKAGTSPELLVEIHGTNALVECMRCGALSDPAAHFEYFERERRAPLCSCGGYLKPATISFGQRLREADLERAFDAAQRCDLAVSLGSTLSVQPAALVPLQAAHRGIPYVIINQGATDQDRDPSVTLRIEGDVVEVFPPAVKEALSG